MHVHTCIISVQAQHRSQFLRRMGLPNPPMQLACLAQSLSIYLWLTDGSKGSHVHFFEPFLRSLWPASCCLQHMWPFWVSSTPQLQLFVTVTYGYEEKRRKVLAHINSFNPRSIDSFSFEPMAVCRSQAHMQRTYDWGNKKKEGTRESQCPSGHTHSETQIPTRPRLLQLSSIPSTKLGPSLQLMGFQVTSRSKLQPCPTLCW